MKSNVRMYDPSEGVDKIVYTLIGKGGGVDGMDRNDPPGQLMDASFSKSDLLENQNLPWGDIKPQVVNLKEARKKALAKLDPIDKLVIGLVKSRVTRG